MNTFDRICQSLSHEGQRRTALKIIAGALLAGWMPRKLQAASCGAMLASRTTTSPNAGCDSGATTLACTSAKITLRLAFLASGQCPEACPPVVQNFVCGCAQDVVTATSIATCNCLVGQVCDGACCAPNQSCCGGACVNNSCSSCGPTCAPCPKGTCCVNGACTSSIGGACSGNAFC